MVCSLSSQLTSPGVGLAQLMWSGIGSDSFTEGETPTSASFPLTVGPPVSLLRQHCGLFPERAPPEQGVTQAIGLQDTRSPRGPAGDTCPPRPEGGPARHTGVSSRERGALPSSGPAVALPPPPSWRRTGSSQDRRSMSRRLDARWKWFCSALLDSCY